MPFMICWTCATGRKEQAIAVLQDLVAKKEQIDPENSPK